VKKREHELLLRVAQYDFPDTADFNGSILSAETPITEATENFAKLALLLFYPYRVMTDIQIANSFTLKFREAVLTEKISERNKEFLQNILDTRSNCFWSAKHEDELE